MVLTVRALTKTYRTAQEQVAVLRGVDLVVAAGESVALTGESGSGKSTLLHLIAGLDQPDSGSINLDGAAVTDLDDANRAAMRRNELGLVFQQFNLISSLTVADNLAFQARIAGRLDPAWQRELIERLNLAPLLRRYPEQISGGQQQRVAIGRALAIKPKLLLADEPTGNLDEDTAAEVLGAGARSRHAFRLRISDGDAQPAPCRDAGSPGQPARGADRMTRAVWGLAVLLSHWRRHPMQLATLLIGLISATALWSGVQALNQQARTSYDRAAAVLGGERTAMLVSPTGAAIPQQTYIDLRRAGWAVSPVLEARIAINGRGYRLVGIDPVTLPREAAATGALPRSDVQAFLTPPGVTLIARDTAIDLGLPEGATPAISDTQSLPPLRLAEHIAPGLLMVDIGVAQRVLNRPGELSRLFVGAPQGTTRAPR